MRGFKDIILCLLLAGADISMTDMVGILLEEAVLLPFYSKKKPLI